MRFKSIVAAPFLILLLYLWNYGRYFPFKLPSPTAPLTYNYTPRPVPLLSKTSGHLPQIPPYIWQFHGFKAEPEVDKSLISYQKYIQSWITHSPSYTYQIVDPTAAQALMAQLSVSQDHNLRALVPIYETLLSHRAMAADFLRYLLLALEGGVYSDIDTTLLRAIHNWVPVDLKASTRLIIGIEFDQRDGKDSVKIFDEVQFCRWTLAAAPSHPLMWSMVGRIASKVMETAAERARPQAMREGGDVFSDANMLSITGPVGWTKEVFMALSRAAGVEIDWRNVTGLKEPRLYGDILVLPINGFGTGQGHSGSLSGGSEDALVKHHFGGSWMDIWR